LLGDDVLVEFLPDALGVALVSLDHTIDRAVDRLGEEVPDFIVGCSGERVQATRRKAR
jgi:hypothetical protein